MPVFKLDEANVAFPDPNLAEKDGLLAVGGELSPKWLLTAYRSGIFPWFNPGDPILWWSPDPRFVLFPHKLKVAKSMRPLFNQHRFQVTFDSYFEVIIRACQRTPRKGQGGTWITESMIAAYLRLHDLGFAHSVEVWEAGQIVGGLYGIEMGGIFFGESMFTLRPNASKFGFITMVRKFEESGIFLIDCQQQTAHLGSLGAEAISRVSFLQILTTEIPPEQIKAKNWAAIYNE